MITAQQWCIDEGSIAHWMYNPQTNKIYISRDVFEEGRNWEWNQSKNSEIAVIHQSLLCLITQQFGVSDNFLKFIQIHSKRSLIWISLCLLDIYEPSNYHEAFGHPNWEMAISKS